MLLNNNVEIAVAGSGKTWGICKEVISKIENNSQKKILLITYTNKGIESLKKTYLKQNLGVLHERVIFKTWYQFLLSEFIKPYQNVITNENNYIKSFDFSKQYGYVNFKARGTLEHYINKSGDVLSNFASELGVDINEKSQGKVIKRLEKIYSDIYIDEVQDLSGEDFKILDLLFKSMLNIKCVGDYKQSTYTTHNTKKNKKITGLNIINYFKNLEDKNIIHLRYNLHTKRFGKEICCFANTIFPNETEEMLSSQKIDVMPDNIGVYIISKKDLEKYYNYYCPQILKYDTKTETDNYNSLNFGQCKGMTFDRVVIYPNNIFRDFLLKNQEIKSKSKYYVAVTRARFSVVFVFDEIFENDSFKREKIQIGKDYIDVSKYITK